MSVLQSPEQTVRGTPRKIDPIKTFDAIVSWIEAKAVKERAPGLIVGLSGTDSILTYLASARAFARLGRADRVLGLNFQHDTKDEFAGKGQAFQCIKSEFNWVANDIFPWLHEQAPQSQLEINDKIEHSDDNIRWGHLFSRAVAGSEKRQGLSGHYFPVGTRNATEQALGSYSQISKNVSMLPIISLFKSEVLQICEYLGVPQIAIDKSHEIDCDCGRFDTQANHITEVDWYIMYKQGMLSRDYVQQNMPSDVYNAVLAFYVEETALNNYRSRTPYIPEQSLAVEL